jgi:hypothetical protein
MDQGDRLTLEVGTLRKWSRAVVSPADWSKQAVVMDGYFGSGPECNRKAVDVMHAFVESSRKKE